MIYDIYLARYTRKIQKASFFVEENSRPDSISMSVKSNTNNYESEAPFESNSYDIDPRCKVLIYAHGRVLKLVSIFIQDSIKKHMAPQYKVSEHKYSPSKVQERK
jgi:hypothetical protein